MTDIISDYQTDVSAVSDTPHTFLHIIIGMSWTKNRWKKKLQESDMSLRYDLSESTNHGLVHSLRCPEAWGHILISPPVLCICSHGSGTQSERSTNSQSPAKIYYSAETLNWTFVCKLWSTTWTLNFNISLYWILPNCVSTLDLTNYPGGHFLTATIHPSLSSMDFIWSCHRNRSYILNSVIHRRFCDIVRLLTFLYKREKHGINATVKNILYLLKVSKVL